MPDSVRYQYATFTDLRPFKPAPEPDFPGQPRKPEMDGVERVEAVDGTGGKTGHVFYMVTTPLGKVGVIVGEWLATDEYGNYHVLQKDPQGQKQGMWNKSNSAGPYIPVVQEGSEKAA